MKIKEVQYVDGYKLKILFTNRKKKIADFEAFLKSAKNPMITENLDVDKFKSVTVDSGFLSWNDGAMEISAESVLNEF